MYSDGSTEIFGAACLCSKCKYGTYKQNMHVLVSSIVLYVFLDVRGTTQNFREFARNNMNTYFKS